MKNTFILSALLMLHTMTDAQTLVFSDSFNDLTSGIFGNSGTVMSSTTNLNNSSKRSNWDLTHSSKVYSGGGTLKLGTSSSMGYIKTDTLNLEGPFTVSFNAYAWSGDSKNIEVKLNGTILQSINLGNNSISDYYFMQSFQVSGNGTGKDVITFSAKSGSNNRFLLDDVAISKGSTTATPIFSSTSGIYPDSQTITLSSATANSNIYYTLDGSTPTSASTLYHEPLHISTTSRIKAIATANGMNNSGIALASFILPIEVSSLAEFQKLLPQNGVSSEYFKFTGQATISFTFTYNNIQNIFMQDDSSGIYLYDTGKKLSTRYTEGDNVTGIIGQLSTTNNIIQFIPTADFGIISTGNTITPIVTTLAEADKHLYMLASIHKVTFSEADGQSTFSTGKTYSIEDPTAKSELRIPTVNSLDYLNEIIPTSSDLNVIITKNSSTQLIPRRKADILSLQASVTTIQNNPVFEIRHKILYIINNPENECIEIYSITGDKIMSSRPGDSQLDLSSLTKGVYFIRNYKLTQKIIIS